MNTLDARLPPVFATPRLERWSSERPLFVTIVLVSLAIWGLLLLSIIGAIYTLLIAAFVFLSHVVFITHVRGSAVRLGPEQFPALWNRVVDLSRRAGLPAPPEAYLMEAGGSLNAFATKLFRGRMIVLFSDLLDACGDDEAARDMVIGHELGHLRLGHLDWFVLTAPGRFMPFLGSAYSRACEFSCDRWGAALCGDAAGATRGLAILAAGGKHGGQVNLQAFVAQRQALDTGWMQIGCWLSTYPPLSARVEALQPALGQSVPHSSRGATRAAVLLSAVFVLPGVAAVLGMSVWVAMMQSQIADATSTAAGEDAVDLPQPMAGSDAERTARVQEDFEAISDVVRRHHQATGVLIDDSDVLAAVWSEYRAGDAPVDPFDGYAYGMSNQDGAIVLVSSGPDATMDTGDDVATTVGR